MSLRTVCKEAGMTNIVDVALAVIVGLSANFH